MTVLVRAASLWGYATLAQAQGVDPVKIMQRVRLTPQHLSDDDNLIPFVSVINLLEQTAHDSGCRDFGLRLAQAQGIGFLGQIALILQHASTLGEALQLATRYIFIHNPSIHLAVVALPDSPDLVDMTLVLNVPNLPVGPQNLERALGIIVQGILTVNQDTVHPQLVRLPHAQIGPKSSYAATYQCDCEFNSSVAAVRIATAALKQPLPDHNPRLHQFALSYLDRHFGNPTQRFGDQVRNLIRRLLSSGLCHQVSMAKLMSISPRTLQRRLSAEGLIFEDVVDDIRKKQLCELLTPDDALPLIQIALMLGYTDVSTLHRSCRRWFNCTLGELRHRLTQVNSDITASN
ncbi:MAG: AraC family transcriptional regulator ligand-binding domain-containing protein [Pseudomonadota bacterium]|jgi:AraC-like DNA-binding protein